jgi:O-antigen/teichoic acid export membrane protein
LLTRLVSIQSLAYYSIAFTFANMTTMFSLAMVQSLIPAFSQLLTPEKKTELNALFSRSLRISVVGLLPSIMFLYVIAQPFFTIWAGPEFGRESVYPFHILLIGIFFSIIVYVPNCVVMAYGRPDILAKVQWIELLPYAFLAYFLIGSYGIVGAALAWTIREMINAVIYIYVTKRIVGVSFNFFNQFPFLLLGFILLLPPMLFVAYYDNFSLWLIPLVIASLIFYFFVVWNKLINPEEIIWLKAKIQGFLKKMNFIGER